jgi:diaminohydroxyphosphoribosylaminopyrimidine deaminase / 5-amino-6-(5-phosphoribosylamino)uracil reductase
MLLGFKRQFRLNPAELRLVTAVSDGDEFSLFPDSIPEAPASEYVIVLSIERTGPFNRNATVIFVNGELSVEILQPGNLEKQDIEFLSYFVPLCVLPARAFVLRRAISILHLAQSIDGRMATLNHNSRWISNAENLVYVHRMRALSDAILIGAHTLMNDKPALTVRYVTGPNPVKVVLGNSADDFTSILESRDRIIRLVSGHVPERPGIENVCMKDSPGYIHPSHILEELYKQGIGSVYIEGGAFTTSSFIKEKAVDLMNFYIAPVILGSGISIEFQGIQRVEDALSLQNCKYMPMGEGFLIRGCIKHG